MGKISEISCDKTLFVTVSCNSYLWPKILVVLSSRNKCITTSKSCYMVIVKLTCNPKRLYPRKKALKTNFLKWYNVPSGHCKRFNILTTIMMKNQSIWNTKMCWCRRCVEGERCHQFRVYAEQEDCAISTRNLINFGTSHIHIFILTFPTQNYAN
jgi:hypothetical protein